MKKSESLPDDGRIWDVKKVEIELGDDGDEWLSVEVFGDTGFSLLFSGIETALADRDGQISTGVEGMHIDVARRLRDFLNYAVPEIKHTP